MGRKPLNRHTECGYCHQLFKADGPKRKFCSKVCFGKSPNSKQQPKAKPRTDPMQCTKCIEWKPLSNFFKDRKGHILSRCRQCMQPSKETKRRSQLKQDFGITLEEWDQLFNFQNQKCAVCTKSFTGKKQPSTDHDHKTGKIRGILHSNCNMGLGAFVDDPTIMRKAAAYLRKHGK